MHQVIELTLNQTLVGFDLKDGSKGTFLSSIGFSCTRIDNEVPHPFQQQDLELWVDEYQKESLK